MIDGGVASHPVAGRGRDRTERLFRKPATDRPRHRRRIADRRQPGPVPRRRGRSSLYVADIYGGNRAAGSATAIVKALGWLAGHRAQVINISLVGPPNKLVERAVLLVQRRGIRARRRRRQRRSSGTAAISGLLRRSDGRDRGRLSRPGTSRSRQSHSSRLCRARRGHGRGASRQRLYQGPRHQLRGTARRRAPAVGRLPRAAGRRSSPRSGPGRSRNCLQRLPDRTKSRGREINLAGLYG